MAEGTRSGPQTELKVHILTKPQPTQPVGTKENRCRVRYFPLTAQCGLCVVSCEGHTC